MNEQLEKIIKYSNIQYNNLEIENYLKNLKSKTTLQDLSYGQAYMIYSKIEDIKDLNLLNNINYTLNNNELLIHFFISNDILDRKMLTFKFIQINNPSKIYFYNISTNKISIWQEKQMKLFGKI